MSDEHTDPINFQRPRQFRSLRLKLTLPLLAVIIPIAMLATYAVTTTVTRSLRDTQIAELVAGAQTISEHAAVLGSDQRREIDRIAFTQNVPQLIAAADVAGLQDTLRPLAAAANLDYVIVGDANGRELVGLQRKSGANYTLSQGALLDKIGFLGSVLSGKQAHASGVVRATDGYALFTAAPVQQNGRIVGVAVAGITLDHALQALRDNNLSGLALYGPAGELLNTSFSVQDDAITLPLDVGQQVLSAENVVPIRDVSVQGTLYQTAYFPLVVDSTPLGVIGLFRPNSLWIATDASRQLLSLAFSALAGLVLIAAFVGVSLSVRRLERMTRVAQGLASGDPHLRTGMEATDEIGELGKAIDVYAQRTQRRHDALEALLRQQRGESARLTAILESIPAGIVVQDLDGRVVLMNDSALNLLGSQRVFRSSALNELTALVTDTLGVALAPGIYSLGEAQRVPLDGKVLHAQAAAILTSEQVRIGTVIVLRDITEDVQREQAREALLAEMAREARTPIEAKAIRGRPEDALQLFINEVNRNAIALQRMIGEIRDLSTLDVRSLRQGQQALPAETLVWNIAREWQPTAAAARVGLHVLVLRRGLLVLGEERRLRWVIGNLVDNAVKFTQSRGHVTLTLRASANEKYAQFSVSDTGVGISADDLPHVFTRFYRGKPLARNGQLILTPGTGQGLFIARRVIEAHGGTLSLTSEVGKGTEVTFVLPLTASVTLDLSAARDTPVPAAQPVDLAAKRKPDVEPPEQ